MTRAADVQFQQIMSRQMRQWLERDNLWVQLNRQIQSPVRDNKGGRDIAAGTTLLAAQVARVIPSRSRSTNLVITTPAGQIVSIKDSMLVGLPDMDVQLKDWFMWQEVAWQVSFIQPDRRWMTVCQLDEMGGGARQAI